MPVTTSNGEHFEDPTEYSFHLFGQGNYDPKTDTFTASEESEPKELYFVRHGDTPLNKESEANKEEAPVRGWTNTPLNAQGRAQAQVSAEKLSKEPITHIVTSDLPRASETASIIGDKLGITPQEHPGLRTWDLGDLTGRTGQEVHDEVDRLCLHAPDERPPNGEAFNEFKDRILGTMGQIAQDHKEHEVLVVSHNSPERVLNAYDQKTGDFDYKKYHSDAGSIDPGEHKKFTINAPAQLVSQFTEQQDPFEDAGIGKKSGAITNETGWMTEPTFRERWQGDIHGSLDPDQLIKNADQDMARAGLRNETEDTSFSIHNFIRGKQKPPPGWMANPFTQFPPSQIITQDQRDPGPNERGGKGPSLRWQDRSVYPNYGAEKSIMPYNPDKPESYNFPIADVENSIESLAQKHGVEGSKMKDIIADVLKHPSDYISPMPGGLGMARGNIPGMMNSRGQLGKFEIADLMKDFEAGMTDHAIAKKYNVTQPAITMRRKQLGYEPKPRGRPPN